MKKFLISLPYIYPLCPLNMNHARMFVIADIIARYSRNTGKKVYFPVASHYSGNSAQNISEIFIKIFSNNNVIDAKQEKIFNLYKNTYNTPNYILKSFTKPLNILDFYSQEILWELKSLNISCDYEYFYTTTHNDFYIFVNTIISLYEKNNLLINNKKKELALNYDNNKWRKKTFYLLNRTEFFQSFHKNNIISAMKNVRSDWGLLRKDGFGVSYNKKWVIDPMFDSELFTIFDLYLRFRKHIRKSFNVKDFFEDLFAVLKNKEKSKNILINQITNCLPCDIFVCEEHLKNWLVKKLYAESLLLDKKYQTKKYFILGMGLLDGKKMSASKAHAILAKDLIDQYGAIKARLIIILAGGHPSKTYNYDKSLPIQVNKILNNFISYLTYITSLKNKDKYQNNNKNHKLYQLISDSIEKNIKGGYYQQAIIELISIIPRKYKSPTPKIAHTLMLLYKRYLEILLPGLLNNFSYRFIN